MKMCTIALLVCLLSTNCFGQNTVAKIKFEQAEEAYTKNDFGTTLVKLKEAEAILGKINPKLLYLRILAQKGLISTTEFDFQVLEGARKNVQFYLKNYEHNEGIEDKYREVYLFSETLEKYPANKNEWDKKIAEENDHKQKEANELLARTKKADAYILELQHSFKWKQGLTKEEFKKFNSGFNTFWLSNRHTKTEKIWRANSYTQGPYEVTGDDQFIKSYTHIISSEVYNSKQPDKRDLVRTKMEEIRKEVLSYYPNADLVKNDQHQIIIKTYARPQQFISFTYNDTPTIRNFSCAFIELKFF